MLPSLLLQCMLTSSTNAPAKSLGVVTVNAPGSLVCTVQVPSPLLVPALNVHPEGTPLMATVIGPLISADGTLRARLMGSPATPAGRFALEVYATPVLPAKSV
ncbi:hypothetical protein D3C76_838980 [compost metagenome]